MATVQAQPPPILDARCLHRCLGEGEGRVHALRGVDLALEHAGVYAISGPSGSGKSTLLYLLGLLDRQDEGAIYIRGEDLSHADDEQRTHARNRLIGFIFQFHFLIPEFTALENIMLPMKKRRRLGEPQMNERARNLLHEVGLADKAHRLGNQLSGGEQQRVAVARALANEPALLLADEPTGNLDQANSDLVFELLHSLAHKTGHAVLMVTHDTDLAARADHTLHMRDGLFV